MSNIFRVKNFFATQIMLSSIQEFEVEGVVFDIMALSAELKKEVESCSSHVEMLSLAADSGLYFDGSRAIDNESLDVSALWGDSALDVDCDPCIQYRVGEKVCEISGLTSALEDMILLEQAVIEEEEEAAKKEIEAAEKEAATEELMRSGKIDGDKELPLVDVDRLNEDEAEARRLIG
jgi:hypothetical protein